jgi:K+-transporting ATPase ATPase C chain
MIKQIKPALVILLTFSILTGILYPLLITGLSQLVFPHQANGSLIISGGEKIGSGLIGQEFTDPKYFWGRPSSSAGESYNASASGGSNFSSMNPNLELEVKNRIQALLEADPTNTTTIPVDLVTSSASGLDPNISVAAAEYQVGRIAKARGLNVGQIKSLIKEYTHGRILGIFGEQTINVLEINLALDELK